LADTDNLRQGCIADTDACEEAVRRGEGSRPYIRKNFDTRLPEWNQAAELGVQEAQWLLARCYDEGLGIEMNKIHALGWHLKAAEQGYPPAQNHIGSCYQNGDSVPQDEAEAVIWYRRAAEQGYAIAQANLAWCCDTASGVAQDHMEAVKWYRRAAEQDEEAAQFNLGVHYEWGSGVERDKQEAMKWYRKAADRGYEKAAEALEKIADEIAAKEKDKAERTADTEQQFRRACKEALADGKLTLEEKSELKKLAGTLELSTEAMKQMFADEKKLFLRTRKVKQVRDAELKFRIACKNVMADGKVTLDEKKQLDALAKSLKLSREVVKRLFEDEKKIFQASQQVAPTRSVELQFRRACKKALADGKVTPEEESQLKNLARFFKMPNEVMKQILADEVKIFKKSKKPALNKNIELQFRKACKEALADGKVTPEEEKQLRSLAGFLKIPLETMKEIFADEAKIFRQTHPKKQTT
jgi:tellurite resistance protein